MPLFKAKVLKIFLLIMFIFLRTGYYNTVSYPNPQTPYKKSLITLAEALLFMLAYLNRKSSGYFARALCMEKGQPFSLTFSSHLLSYTQV